MVVVRVYVEVSVVKQSGGRKSITPVPVIVPKLILKLTGFSEQVIAEEGKMRRI